MSLLPIQLTLADWIRLADLDGLTELSCIEYRRRKALGLFQSNPDADRTYWTDELNYPGYVVITIALKSGATGEMYVPRESYDPFLFTSCLKGRWVQ